MSNPNDTTITDPREAVINAGDATEDEAKLIAAGTEVDDEGNPTDAAAAADAQAAADAEAKAAADAAAAKATDDADAAAKADADAKAAETAAAADTTAQAQQAPAAPALTLPPKPEPPQDFAAERAKLKQGYEDGDFDQDEYLEKREALTIEEAAFKGRLSAWETHTETLKAQAEAAAAQAFDSVALAWEKEHAAFIANPLRAEAMQKALHQVDDGKMSPAELFAAAQKIAFEAFNYTPPAPATATGKTPEQVKAEALKERAPKTDTVPQTLATAPQAATLDPNTASVDKLDTLDINSLEDTLARMTPEQQRQYLDAAPGGPGQQQFED